MPQRSDSNYNAVTRHLRRTKTVSRLEDDEIILPDNAEAPTNEDAVAISPASSAIASSSLERRRREEGWGDLGLDQIMSSSHALRDVDAVVSMSGGAQQ